MQGLIPCEDQLLAVARVRFLYRIRTALRLHFRLTRRCGGVCTEDAHDIPIARKIGIRLPLYLPPCTMMARLCSWCLSTVGKPKIGGGGRVILDPALPRMLIVGS